MLGLDRQTGRWYIGVEVSHSISWEQLIELIAGSNSCYYTFDRNSEECVLD